MKIDVSNKTVWIAVGIIAILIVAGIFIFRGSSESTENQLASGDSSSPLESSIEEIPLCSNQNYTTERVNSLVQLDSASAAKLTGNISRRGESALLGIADLSCLQKLDLSKTQISDLSSLSALREMRILFLDNTGLGDITFIRDMTKLQTLSVSGTSLYEVNPIISTPNLKSLNISYSHANKFSALQNSSIEILDISGLSITDIRDIEYVYGMRNLEKLYLIKTSFPGSCSEARTRLPNTEIIC